MQGCSILGCLPFESRGLGWWELSEDETRDAVVGSNKLGVVEFVRLAELGNNDPTNLWGCSASKWAWRRENTRPKGT